MSNIFKKIFSSIKKFSGSTENSAIGIDIGTSAIKVVEIKKRGGKALLETYGAIALGSYAEVDNGSVTNLPVDKISEALKEVLKQSGVQVGMTTTSVAFAIPVKSSLVFTIELPVKIKESEMASVIPTEARKYIPVPITEVSIDYFVLPKKEPSFVQMNMIPENAGTGADQNEKNNVLVVATQNDAVSKFRSILSQCSLTSTFFEIEIFSSVRANFEHELSPVLLMDFGASATKLSIAEFGMVNAYHTIDRGGADITTSISQSLSIPFSEAENMKKEFGFFGNPAKIELADIIKTHIDYIFSETNNVLLGYEKKYNRTISKVILSGGGALLKGLKETATNNFKAEIEIGRPFSKVNAPAFLGKVLETMGPEFAVALGVALRKLQ